MPLFGLLRTGRAGGGHRHATRLGIVVLAVAALTAGSTAVAGASTAVTGASTAVTGASTTPNGTIDFQAARQHIDGFGFSEAFQRATIMRGDRGLTPQHQREVLDLLLSRSRGAGLSILRMGIGGSSDNVYDHQQSIEPVDPGGPNATPQYVWNGDDGGQVWLAQQAKAYGVRRFYADAWSPPGYMKDNGNVNNGGALCGLPGTSCASGDWRQAYANYLVQYARFYASEGIRITDLGFTNEPDLAVSYASMQITPAQAADMLTVLGPTVARSGLRMNVLCCDAAGWQQQAEYSAAIEANKAADFWTRIQTGHYYRSPANTPLPTDEPTWMSEWNPNGNTWNESWDDGSGWAGITVAQSIHDSLTLGNVSAYVYWFGASTGATRALIQLSADGDGYRVSKRLWAIAAYSRFIRPGAVRVAAEVTDPALEVSAFRNADGSRVLEVINTSTEPVPADFALSGSGGRGHAAAYLTDETHSLSPIGGVAAHGRQLTAQFAPRSLTTIVLPH